MAKRYHRKKLNQAIAAACLTVTAMPAISATPALAAVTVSSSTYTVNTGSGDPGQVILGNSGSLIVATTGDGGVISGSNPGVLVTGGATAGSISNSGSISGDLAGILITNGSDVSGGITNALGASIQGTAGTSAVGINISSSSVMTGAIVNNGTIFGGTGDGGAGIKVANSSDIIGGIVNTGTISGYAGILVKSNSDISGGITNGDINNPTAAISGNQIGIYVGTTSNITGGISNFGTISGGQRGIKIEGGSTIGGSITNNEGGTISGATSAGIYIQSSSTITGAVNNSGDILGQQYGIYAGNGSTIGSITNNAGGYIAGAKGEFYVGASLAGIYITESEVTGNISNRGTIMGRTGIYVGGGSAIGGDITNGDINTASAAISGSQTGIYVGTTSNITGGISNFGTISGGQRGIKVEGGSTIGGSITNNEGGTISGATSAGIYIQSSTITGAVNNSGDILSRYYGIYVGNGSTLGGITNNAGATIQANTSDSVAGGIYLTESTVSGNIANSGIISGPMGIYVISSTIEGNITNDVADAAISGSQTGIALSQSNITGGISNSGTISGGRTGIYVGNNSEISNGITNYADATILGASSPGIDIQSSIIGNITNSGEILGQNYGISVRSNSTIGGITNNAGGTITGTNIEGISIQNSFILGDIINAGIISGVNSGIFIGSSTVGDGIFNAGSIVGQTRGLSVNNSTTTGSITNSADGQITGVTGTGVYINNGSTITGGITNDGTITGGMYAINIEDTPVNPITITNTGTLNGAVNLANSILNLEGTTGRVTGAVTGAAGSTVNVNGTFTTENTFSVDGFNIGAAGIFNMAHGVTATGGVSNGGTLSVAAGNTATITGDYTQTVNGIFQTGASSLTNYGKLVVTGTADLSASNKVDVKVSAGDTLANGNVLTSVLSAGTLTAGTIAVTDNSALWNFSGTVNGNAIDLTTEQALTFADAVSGGAVSPAAAGVASALDVIQEAGATGDMLAVLNRLGTLATEAEVAAAVTQLMPGFAGGSASIVQGLAGSGGSRVVHEHMTGGGQGLSSGDPMFKDRMVWAQPFYSWTDQNERKGVAGYNADSYGLALGADGKVNEQWRVGVAFSLAKGDVEGDSPVTRNNLDINTYQITLYAADRLSEATSLNLQAGFGVNDNDSSRQIVFGGLNRIASADYTSWHTLLDAELEHRYKVSEKTSLASYLRAQYSYVAVEDYTETGAGAINLHMDDNSEDSLILSVGGKAAYALADGVKLTGKLGVGYDLMANQSSVTATFAGGGPAFVTEGLDPSAFVMQGGLGFEMLAANGLTVTARYDVDGREDYTNQVATINFRLPF